MIEVQAIINAFDEANARGERCALATVVSVEGSSYRGPGARMLVCESGLSMGMISAGCLESDVIEHAKRVIKTNLKKLVEYDTTSTSDEIVWGLGLGCNGIVRVLVEPLAPQSSFVDALRRSIALQADVAPIVVATVFQHSPSSSTPTSAQIEIGSRLIIDENGEASGDLSSSEPGLAIAGDMRAAVREDASGVHVYEWDGGTTKVFIETLRPPVQLVVFGAGLDAVPIIELAHGLGWQTEVVDPQARPASSARFSQADKVTLARPETVSEEVRVTPRTLALLMSHNYAHDQALLKFLLASPARYIGVMGSRKRTERMLNELLEDDSSFRIKETDGSRLYAPAGLDIGANNPAEIALSIIAEMRTVLADRRGGMLRERQGAIHTHINDSERVSAVEVSERPVAAA
jgi:xanthine/CO dehydrogenase XdhC/CoxF family maturation factor